MIFRMALVTLADCVLADCVFRAKCSPRFRIENITSSHSDCREFLQTFRIWKDLHVSLRERYAGELCVMSTRFDGHADNYIQNQGGNRNLPKGILPHSQSVSGKRMEFLTSVPVSNISFESVFRGNRDTIVEGILTILNTILNCT